MIRQLFKYDPIVGYRYIPGLKARIPHEGGGYLIRVNDSGFRCNHDFRAKKNKKYRRIILFGNSYTAGDGVSNGDRFGDLLEKKIKNLEIYNFGLPGTGLDQHYLIYKEISMNIKYDMLMIALFVDNIRRVASHSRYFYDEKGKTACYEKPYYELIDGKLFSRNIPPRKETIRESDLSKEERNYIDKGPPIPIFIHKFISRLTSLSIFKRIFLTSGFKDQLQNIIHYQPVPEYNDRSNPAWQLMRAILKEWIINQKKQVLLMPIPFYHHVMNMSDATKYQSRMQEIAFETGCILHDPLPNLMNYPKKERRRFYFEKDGHLTPNGHKAITKSLIPVIQSLLDNN